MQVGRLSHVRTEPAAPQLLAGGRDQPPERVRGRCAQSVEEEAIAGGDIEPIGLGRIAWVQRTVDHRARCDRGGRGQIDQAEGEIADGIARRIDAERVAPGGQRVDRAIATRDVAAVAIEAAEVLRVAALKAAACDQVTTWAREAPGEVDVGKRVEDHRARLGDIERVDHPLAGCGDAAFDGIGQRVEPVDDAAGVAIRAAVGRGVAGAVVELVIKRQPGFAAIEHRRARCRDFGGAAHQVPDAHLVDAAHQRAKAAVGLVGAADEQRLHAGACAEVGAHRAADHQRAIDVDAHHAGIAVDGRSHMGGLAELDRAAAGLHVLLATGVARAQQQVAAAGHEQRIGAPGAQGRIVCALVDHRHVAVGELGHVQPGFDRHGARGIECRRAGRFDPARCADPQAATQRARHPVGGQALRLADRQGALGVDDGLQVERIVGAGARVGDTPFQQQGVGAGLRGGEGVDVAAGGGRPPGGLAIGRDQAPPGVALRQPAVEEIPVSGIRGEAVGVGFIGRAELAGDQGARGQALRLAQIDQAKAVVAGLVGDAVDGQRVIARLQVERGVAAQVGAVGRAQRGGRHDRAVRAVERPLQLAVRRQGIEDDADVVLQREAVFVDLAGDVDAAIDAGNDRVARQQHARFQCLDQRCGAHRGRGRHDRFERALYQAAEQSSLHRTLTWGVLSCFSTRTGAFDFGIQARLR